MIIYNVTSSVDTDIADEWVAWMKGHHIPQLLKTGLFAHYKILKVLTHDEESTISFAVQYYATSIGDVQKYLDNYAPKLREDVSRKYGDKVVAYRTVLEEV